MNKLKRKVVTFASILCLSLSISMPVYADLTAIEKANDPFNSATEIITKSGIDYIADKKSKDNNIDWLNDYKEISEEELKGKIGINAENISVISVNRIDGMTYIRLKNIEILKGLATALYNRDTLDENEIYTIIMEKI